MKKEHVDIIIRALNVARTRARLDMTANPHLAYTDILREEIAEYDEVLQSLEIKIDENDKGCCAEDCNYKEEKFCTLFKAKLFGTLENPTRCGECNNYIA